MWDAEDSRQPEELDENNHLENLASVYICYNC